MPYKDMGFKVQDWSSYNQILKNRWSLDRWFSPQIVKTWRSTNHPCKKGATLTYSREAILVCLTLRALFNLSLRTTEGLVQSFIKRLGLPRPCPSYSQLCRRAEGLNIKLPRLTKGQAFGLEIEFMNRFFNPLEGQEAWKRSSAYGIRSLVETAIMRFKRPSTDKLRSRKPSTQKVEARIKAFILNRMLQGGIPHTIPSSNRPTTPPPDLC